MRKSIFMALLGLIVAVPAFAINKAPVKELVVASDGEFTSITAALASLPTPNPDTNPVVIKVMPGTYVEADTLVMKDNVNLEGSGAEFTTIDLSPNASGWSTISLTNIASASISRFTIKSSIGNQGIKNIASSPTIRGNIFNCPYGVRNENGSSPLISDNTFKEDGSCVEAILNYSSSPTITNNLMINIGCNGIVNHSSSPIITGNKIIGTGNRNGIYSDNMSSPTISNNIITGSSYRGIVISGGTIINNKITGNALDIYPSGGSKISLNEVDSISGTKGMDWVGNFNVKSDGSQWPQL